MSHTIQAAYLKPLDSLRAVAILMVVFFHSPVPAFQLDFGWMGVNLFFILSGFLITRILINSKKNIGIESIRGSLYFTSFYTRRALRIFPVYYLYLIVIGVLLFFFRSTIASEFLNEGWLDFRNHWRSLISFTYNFQEVFNYFQHSDYNNSYFFGHLWSLSVEIQFYLAFACAIYFLSADILKKVLVFAIISIPFLRLLFVSVAEKYVEDLFWIGDVLYISTIFNLDTLSVGACLALFSFAATTRRLIIACSILLFITITIGLIHLLLARQYNLSFDWDTLGFDIPAYHPMTLSPNYLFNNRYLYSIPLINFTFASFTLLAIHSQAFLTFFNNRILHRIGKISYAMYIYHLCLSWLATCIFDEYLKVYIPSEFLAALLTLFIYLLVLFSSAELSFRFFEKKFLKRAILPAQAGMRET